MATKKQQSKQPANTLRCGNINATIWKNESQNSPFFSTNFLVLSRIKPANGATVRPSASLTLRRSLLWLFRLFEAG
jgi:hypothetical protein